MLVELSDTSCLGEKTHLSLGEGIFIDVASLPRLECGPFNYYKWLLFITITSFAALNGSPRANVEKKIVPALKPSHVV
jgi:hypothetical protein